MNVGFEVGAKAARLIGRENIADVDGALIELIKNAYDADAACVYVCFDMPFPHVPSEVSPEKFIAQLSCTDLKQIDNYYNVNDNGNLQKKNELTSSEKSDLERLLFKYNRIVVADNGIGMSKLDVTSKWMYIGTNDKEINSMSFKGRIKTGAKGIGRFALDKLSVETRMYTKQEGNPLVSWKINWNQFANMQLLKDISAEIEESPEDYEEVVRNELGNNFLQIFKDFHWNTGTMIILTPIREEWTERLFQKVILNLKSINPLGSLDVFRVLISNQYFPRYNFVSEEISIAKEDYDYKITIHYDGNNQLTTRLLRNEVDLKKKSVTFDRYDLKVDLDSFWARPFFQQKNCNKEDYDREIALKLDVTKLLNDDIEKIHQVGEFSAEFYFLKREKSTFEIIKTFTQKDRKALIEKFAGIKLYRDKFKVRPYGDSGTYFDWLDLGRRQQLSPGGVGSESGSWRVLPYQLIGQVNISRFTNETLQDMSNREGLAQNDSYLIFVNMLQEAIRLFEIDRQNFYREYSSWVKDIEKGLSKDEQIRAEAKRNAEKKTQEEKNESDVKESKDIDIEPDEQNDSNFKNSNHYTDQEYQDTVYHLMKEVENNVNEKQILQLLGSSGLILNTFFHEFKAISSHYGSRSSQLRKRVDHLLGDKEYKGSFVYNPYIIIDKMQETDDMLALWLKIAMQGIEKPSLKIENHSLSFGISNLLEKWSDLLDSKEIKIIFNRDESKEFKFDMAIADIYIIINNFLLNSVWFLEHEKNEHREIELSLTEDEKYYYLNMRNNGPKLDEKYTAIPNRIFELGETSKEDNKGTGVGLWIMRETVERYGGTVLVAEIYEGFGIDIHLKK